VVALVAGVGAAFALAHPSREPVEVTVASDPDSTTTPADDPNRMWGRVWDLELLTINGTVMDVPSDLLVDVGAGGVPHLDLRRQDEINFLGCRWLVPAEVRGDRLVFSRSEATDASAECVIPLDHKGVTSMTAFSFLYDATIELRGDRLSLTSADGVAEFVERRPGGN
jgi:hypothetical protein